MKTEIVIQAVKEMIADNESELYIRIYLNDLARSKDITWEENGAIYEKYVIPYLTKTNKGIDIF